ncbi:MAG: AMP-dependent synthetase/ligase [Myxococcaceae bacterium]
MRAEQQMAPVTAQQNLVSLLVARAARPDAVGATSYEGGGWKNVTWAAIRDEVRRLSAALVSQGVKPGDRVAIFAATSLRWCVVDLAVSAARGVTIPIYASNTSEEVHYILDHSGASLLFVDDDTPEGRQPGRLSRVRSCIGRTPAVKAVVLFEGVPSGTGELSYRDFIAKGDAVERMDPKGFETRVAAIKMSDPCLFIYTSGTTGNPKGVQLTHGNWAYEASIVALIQLMGADDAVMLFLPLAHSFAQVVKAAWLSMGFRMVFSRGTEKLMADLAETSPTILPSVPRIFEKVYEGVVTNGSSAPGLKGRLFRWAMRLFDGYVNARLQGREYSSLSFALAKRLVFSKVRATLDAKLGGQMRLFVSGGAPLSRKIAYFFDLLGFVVLEGYGLTETSAAATINRPGKVKIGTVGPPIPGCEVKIASDGEILIRGPNVMAGYYRNPEATQEAIAPDGWFRSGDIGELDADGSLRITDRKKDIIVTAGGKNVAPQNIENALKTRPLISQVMVYGDKRKYLSALITVNEEAAKRMLAAAGAPPAQSYAELAKRAEVIKAVQVTLDDFNAHEPPYNQLKRFALVDHDFSQETGELTPTLKVKRKACTLKYQLILDGLYDGEKVTI